MCKNVLMSFGGVYWSPRKPDKFGNSRASVFTKPTVTSLSLIVATNKTEETVQFFCLRGFTRAPKCCCAVSARGQSLRWDLGLSCDTESQNGLSWKGTSGTSHSMGRDTFSRPSCSELCSSLEGKEVWALCVCAHKLCIFHTFLCSFQQSLQCDFLPLPISCCELRQNEFEILSGGSGI